MKYVRQTDAHLKTTSINILRTNVINIYTFIINQKDRILFDSIKYDREIKYSRRNRIPIKYIFFCREIKRVFLIISYSH